MFGVSVVKDVATIVARIIIVIIVFVVSTTAIVIAVVGFYTTTTVCSPSAFGEAAHYSDFIYT